MAGNGSSYQKGGYESIPIDQDGNTANSGNKKKLVIGALVAIVLAFLGVSAYNKRPGAAIDAAMEKANLPKTKSGEIKLFDEHREFI